MKDVLDEHPLPRRALRLVEFVHGTRDGERRAFPVNEPGEVYVFEDGETYKRRTDRPEACQTTGEIGVWHYDLLPIEATA